MSVNRRQLMAGAGTAGLGFALAGAVDAVFAGTANAATPAAFKGYGELVADPKKVVDLPKGFRYTVFSKAGKDTLDGPGGGLVPAAHDGMRAFPAGIGRSVLVRNHELSPGTKDPIVPQRPGLVYDPATPGGTTTLTVAGDRLLRHVPSLAGTYRNCAGGGTPWNTWLTCEETEATPASEAGLTKKHGYVFEVDPFGRLRDDAPVPLTALGRFPHEAVAIDPRDGTVYLTEDAAKPYGLVYRFQPKRAHGGPGSLRAGGKLQALQVPAVRDLSAVRDLGTSLSVTWVDVPDPDATTVSVRAQFDNAKVTRVPKAEGIFWSRGVIYLVSSYAKVSEGAALDHSGQVWRFDPKRATLELVLRLEVGGRFDSPDNSTVSPFGGIVLCEDGDGENYLVAPSADGTPYPLARNAGSDSEWAGATFSADGKWLYANIQGDGLTVAITGPWWRG
ncbi:alkaline phosphatase PhoX [Candidatus Frankia nodulisporulans]|uniref:alkaline phosphatase PhoX n=1 Tax=Candidatus Frankia nodulisporulans TaxID=2060052 RepID=UPI0013D3C431|nr:alkaline phosphatase PhoX [Candidatus Frankia nodulisporulans]